MIYNIWYQKYIIVKLYVFFLVGLCVGLGLLVVGGWLRNSSGGKHSLGKWPWFPSHTDNHLRAAIIRQPVIQIHLQIQSLSSYIYLLFASADPVDLFILILTWRVLSLICHSESSILHFKDVQHTFVFRLLHNVCIIFW